MTVPMNKNMRQVFEQNNNRFPNFAWPGMYDLVYVNGDGETFCGDCASKLDAEFDAPIVDCFSVSDSEGYHYCAECNKHLCNGCEICEA